MSASASPSAPPGLEVLLRRWRAAEALWARGYPAESYVLLRSALRAAAATLERIPEPDAALLAELRALLAEAEALGDQAAAADYTRAHALWLERARRLASRLARDLERRGRRRGRLALVEVTVGAGLVAAVLVALLSASVRVKVGASGAFHPDLGARNAFDGLVATEWILPGGKPGHLDLVFPSRRAVHAVVLTNAHNRSHMDRAAKRVRVVVLDGTRTVDEATADFEKIAAPAITKRVALRGRHGTAVRVEVLEFHGRGGGLAEVSLE